MMDSCAHFCAWVDSVAEQLQSFDRSKNDKQIFERENDVCNY